MTPVGIGEPLRICESSAILGSRYRDGDHVALFSADGHYYGNVVRRARAGGNLNVHLIQSDESWRDSGKLHYGGYAIKGHGGFIHSIVCLAWLAAG